MWGPIMALAAVFTMPLVAPPPAGLLGTCQPAPASPVSVKANVWSVQTGSSVVFQTLDCPFAVTGSVQDCPFSAQPRPNAAPVSSEPWLLRALGPEALTAFAGPAATTMATPLRVPYSSATVPTASDVVLFVALLVVWWCGGVNLRRPSWHARWAGARILMGYRRGRWRLNANCAHRMWKLRTMSRGGTWLVPPRTRRRHTLRSTPWCSCAPWCIKPLWSRPCHPAGGQGSDPDMTPPVNPPSTCPCFGRPKTSTRDQRGRRHPQRCGGGTLARALVLAAVVAAATEAKPTGTEPAVGTGGRFDFYVILLAAALVVTKCIAK